MKMNKNELLILKELHRMADGKSICRSLWDCPGCHGDCAHCIVKMAGVDIDCHQILSERHAGMLAKWISLIISNRDRLARKWDAYTIAHTDEATRQEDNK